MPSVSAASPPLVTSQPLTGTSATTLTTAAFNAPANSVVVAMVSRDGATTEAPTYSTSGTALTWTVVGLRNQSDGAGTGWVNASAGMTFAPIVTARTGMTVTASYATAAANQMALQVFLLTDVDMSDPLGAFLEGSDANVTNVTTDPITLERTGSLMVAVLSGGKVTGQPSLGGAIPASSDLTETAWNVGNELFGLQGYKTLGAAGTTATATASPPLAGLSSNWNWIVAEFQAPVTGVDRAVTSVTGTATAAEYTMLQGEVRAVTTEPGTATASALSPGHAAAETSSTGTATTGAVASVAHAATATAQTGVAASSSVTVAHFATAAAPTGVETTASFIRDTVALPSTGPLFFDFWVVDRTTGALTAPLPDYESAMVAPVFGEPGAITIKYPVDGKNYELLRNNVTRKRDLEIEVWVGGRRDAALRAILMQSSVDQVEEQPVATFSGHFLPILLDEMVVLPDPAAEKQETKFVAATPGGIVKTLMQRAQAAGYLTGLSTSSFSTATDSNGIAWGVQTNVTFSPGRSYMDALGDLADAGLCEFEVTRDRQLRLYKFGTRGVDRTTQSPPLVLRRGKHLRQSPRTTSVREAGTDLIAAGKEGLYRTESNATALAERGRRILRYATAAGIEDVGALTAWAQAQMTVVAAGRDEGVHELSFGPGDALPIADYDLGDWVGVATGDPTVAYTRERVMQWSFEENEHGEVSGSIVTGTPFSDSIDRLRRRITAIERGATVIGTSTPPSTEDTKPPAAPTGIVVDSLAYADDVAGTLATLIVGWTAVTTNSDGTAADDVSGYVVQWRPAAAPADAWQLGQDKAGGTSESVAFGGVPAGAVVRVRVAAYDYNGNTSAWSTEVEVTTETDTTAPPVPSAPSVFARLGILLVEWDGLGSAGEDMPADFDYVEVHMSTSSNFAPTEATYYDRLYARGTMPVADQPYGVAQFFRLVAVDRTTPTPNRSDPSAQASGTPGKVVADDIFDGAVGSLALASLAVKTVHIDNGAVNDLQVGNLSVGKLTAGTFSTAMTLTGIIRTALTGLRWEGDNAGIRFYNAAGALTIRLEGTSGNSLLTGLIQTGLTGSRVVLEPAGTFRLYPPTGTNFNLMYNAGTNGLIFRSGLDGSDRAGFLYLQSSSAQISYGRPGTLVQNTRLQCSLHATEMWAPILAFRVDRSFPTDGTSYRAFFSNFRNGADDADTVLWYQDNGNAEPWWFAPGKNVALTFAGSGSGAGSLFVSTGQGGPASISASAFNQTSTVQVKDNVGDARLFLDPLEVIRNARSKSWNYTFEMWQTPLPTPDNPDPEPVPVESPPVRFGPVAEDLPGVLIESVPGPNGTRVPGINLASQIGVMWGALGQIQDQEIRSVAGRVAVPNGTYMANQVVELPVLWDETPLEVPTGGVVSIHSAIAWLGKTTAKIKPGSLTETGCTVVVRALAPVVPTNGNPITVEAQALYLYTPPFQPEA